MNKTYKWTLRKSSKKEVCPNCGQRRFVPYVRSEDNTTMLGAEYGRCDREDHCGYWKMPDGKERVQTEAAVMPAPDWMRIPYKYVENFMTHLSHSWHLNSLYSYACWLVGVRDANAAFARYRIGHLNDGACLFWQIDRHNEVHAGKAILYKDGHRVKNTGVPARWVHKMMPSLVRGKDLQQCFFGEHLVVEGKTIVVVESEKTAMLMSAIEPQFTWLAAGGAQGLGDEKCKAIDGRTVILLPDNGKAQDWRKIALRHGWRVDDSCSMMADGLQQGYDILDVYEARKREEDVKSMMREQEE